MAGETQLAAADRVERRDMGVRMDLHGQPISAAIESMNAPGLSLAGHRHA